MSESHPEGFHPPDLGRPVAELPAPNTAGPRDRPVRDGRGPGGGWEEFLAEHLLVALRRHWVLVLAGTLALGAVAAYLDAQRQPIYRATAVIRLAGERRTITSQIDNDRPPPVADRGVDPFLSLIQFFTSRSLVGNVVDSLGLQWHRIPGADTGFMEVPRDVAINLVLANLKVVPRAGTNVAEVRYTDPDPARAQQVVNAVVRTFQTRAASNERERARNRRAFLEEQLDKTNQKLVAAEMALASLRGRLQAANSEERLGAEQSALLSLAERQGELDAERRVVESLLAQLSSPDPGARQQALQALTYSPEVASDRRIERLHQQAMDYRARLDSLTTGPWRSRPTSPEVVQVAALLESAQNELVAAMRARAAALAARSDALAALRRQGDNAMRTLPVRLADEARLNRQVEGLKATTDQLRREYEKARIAEALEVGDIEIMDLASLPQGSISTRRWLVIGLGLGLGLLASGGLAVFLERRDRSIRRPEELSSTVGMPGLAIVPQLLALRPQARLARRFLRVEPIDTNTDVAPGVMVRGQAASLGAESFRMLGINLRFGWRESPKTVVVTSAVPQEGKTLVAANLAAIHAREGLRVLLVDCDIHRPQLHRLFRLPRAPGLTDFLHTEAGAPASRAYTFGDGDGDSDGAVREDPEPPRYDGIRGTPQPGLFVLPCGNVPVDHADLFRPAVLERGLRTLSAQFDLVILDTPPVLASADAAMLAPLTDTVVFVVRAGQTSRDAVAFAYQQLTSAGARAIGAVLNDPGGIVRRYSQLYYPYTYGPASND